MKFNILTIFPQVFDNFHIFEGVIKKAIFHHLIDVNIIDLKKFKDTKRIDDKVYGSEFGQLYQAKVIDDALQSIQSIPNYQIIDQKNLIIYMSPRGEKITSKNIKQFLKYDEITIINGRYEGIDQRIIDKYMIKEVSLGDFIASNGDIPSALFIDVLARHIPDVVQKDRSVEVESFSSAISANKEYPQFSTPSIFDGMKVPDVFLSGNHVRISDMQNRLSISPRFLSSYLTYDTHGISKISRYIQHHIMLSKPHFPYIFFYGTLGCGKTTLIKDLLSVFTDDDVSSPTYSLVNMYKGNALIDHQTIYHIDLYRINDVDELYQIELDNILNSPYLTLIEWAEKIPASFLEYSKRSAYEVEIKYIDDNTRQYNFNF